MSYTYPITSQPFFPPHLYAQYYSSAQKFFNITTEEYKKCKMDSKKITCLQTFMQQGLSLWNAFFANSDTTISKSFEQVIIMGIITFIAFLCVSTFHLITGFYFLIKATHTHNKNHGTFTPKIKIRRSDFITWLYDRCITQDSFTYIFNDIIPATVITPRHNQLSWQEETKYRRTILQIREELKPCLQEFADIITSTEDHVQTAFICTNFANHIINKYQLTACETSLLLEQIKALKDMIQTRDYPIIHKEQ